MAYREKEKEQVKINVPQAQLAAILRGVEEYAKTVPGTTSADDAESLELELRRMVRLFSGPDTNANHKAIQLNAAAQKAMELAKKYAPPRWIPCCLNAAFNAVTPQRAQTAAKFDLWHRNLTIIAEQYAASHQLHTSLERKMGR